MLRTHTGLENTSLFYRDPAALPILKTSFLDVSATCGFLANISFKAMLLNQRDSASQETAVDVWRYFWSSLGRLGVEGHAIGIWCINAKDGAKHPTVHDRTAPEQRIIWSKVSRVPRFGSPDLEV